jgi:hypothetical protein
MKNKMVSISDQECAWLEEEAKKQELTFSGILRRIIDNWHEKQDKNYEQK